MFREETVKIISNPSFLIAVLSVIIILLSGTVYTSPVSNKQYNVWNFVFNKDNQELNNNSNVYFQNVAVGQSENYLSMFAPIIAAIPFVIGISGEKKNNNVCFTIYRTGKNKFFLGKYLSTMFSAGLIFGLGYAGFLVMAGIVFPQMPSGTYFMEKEMLIYYGGIGKWISIHGGTFGIILLKFIKMYIYGALSVVLSFGISAVIKNRYMIAAIPFLIHYFWSSFTAYQSNIYIKLSNTEYLSDIMVNEPVKQTIIFGIFIVTVGLLYRFNLQRKGDCCE